MLILSASIRTGLLPPITLACTLPNEPVEIDEPLMFPLACILPAPLILKSVLLLTSETLKLFLYYIP